MVNTVKDYLNKRIKSFKIISSKRISELSS